MFSQPKTNVLNKPKADNIWGDNHSETSSVDALEVDVCKKNIWSRKLC